MFEIALVHPDIPQNTGNVARLCVGLDVPLHLVRPMGFVLDDKKMKRAGLDYWPHLKLHVHDHDLAFQEAMLQKRLFFFSTKATKIYSAISYQAGDVLAFGSESRGLPEEYHQKYAEQLVTIPMPGAVRSLNLSNAVACAAYEVYRQLSKSV